ncbi:hypothetical protein DXG01_006488 [Tephrocybe rancida]|nr:hypothetical protein DXG01_006488 [Tephrocybe rancida]
MGGECVPDAESSCPVHRFALDSSVFEDLERHIRELAFEKLAKSKERTKTEEDVALEEKETLEKAERRRQKRMLGLEESDSEDEGKSRGKWRRGDDLDNDFADDDEWDGLGAGLGGAAGIDDEAEGSGSSEKEGSDEEEGGGESGSEEEEDEEDSENDAEEGEHEDLIQAKKSTSRKATTKGKAKELPFTFPCPSTHEDFFANVDNVSDDDVPVVIKRIRALYRTSLGPLGPDDKFKLQAVEHFVEKITLMHKNLKHGLSRGALEQEAIPWLGLPELSLLWIIGSTWSTSDFNHAVISQTRVFLEAYLSLGRVRPLSDITSGLFLCTLFLQFEALSKRLVPEAINFLTNTVLHIVPQHYQTRRWRHFLTQLTSLIDTLGRLLKFSRPARQPLWLQAHKPIPIPSYIPKFEATTSNYLRRQDHDHERNKASKLHNQYKQERKGAIR